MKRDIAKPLLVVGAALILAFCFDILFYRKVPGISVPLFTVLLLGTTFTLARRSKIAIDAEVVILAVLIFISSIMIFVRSSATLVTLDIVAILYLFALLLGRLAGMSIRKFVIVNYLRQAFGASLQSLLESFYTFRDVISARDELRKSAMLRQTGRGIAITLPVLAVFIALLSSADLVFSKYVNHVAMALRRLNFIEHAAIIVIATIILSGMFAYALSRRGQKQGEEIELAIAKRMLILGFAKAFFLLCVVSIVSLAIVPIILLILGILGQPFVKMYWPFLIVALPAIFTTAFTYIFYRYQLQRSSEERDISIASRIRTLAFTESVILLGSVNGLLAFFIVIQFTYLFGGAHNIAAQGFTYAEYAHRGFFELVAVALLSFVV
ncbi:MAG TPA: DUF4153 domain-containing protein, partial [Anaerolineae bacterium]|nr:DUF4153 domain-containing protein [Anaerolineae bacterium]